MSCCNDISHQFTSVRESDQIGKAFSAFVKTIKSGLKKYIYISKESHKQSEFAFDCKLFRDTIYLLNIFEAWNFLNVKSATNGVQNVREHDLFLRILFHLEPWHCLQLAKACKKALISCIGRTALDKFHELWFDLRKDLRQRTFISNKYSSLIKLFNLTIVQKKSRRTFLPPQIVFQK